MADLTGTTPANTYKGLLQVNDYTDGIAGNTGSNALAIQDGAGNATALAISTDNVGIGTTSPIGILHVDSSLDGPIFDSGGTGNSNHAFLVRDSASNQLLRVNNNGNIGIGTTSPDYKLDLQSTTDPVTLGLKGYGSFVDGSVACQILFLGKDNAGGNRGLAFIKVKEHDHALGTGSIEFETRVSGTEATRMIIASDGNVTPGTNDVQDFGSASLRWDDIYATNTTIQSSDRELKQDIEELSEAETRVAQACKGLLRKYRWKSSVEEKGDEARIHFGIIAQDLEAAFAAEGLDAGRYGMFVKNTWWTADRVIPAVEAVEAVEAVYDEEGNIVSPAVEAVESQPEKTVTDIFNNSEDAPEGATEVTQRGVRYSELLAFIIAAI